VSARRALALAALAALACAKPRDPITTCDATPNARPICRFHNPEDLAVLAGARALVVSQLGSVDGSAAGSLVFYDVANDAVAPAFPVPGAPAPELAPGWGDAACPGPPGAAFDPHGIDLATRPDGKRELLVVNHGGRESIELLEVDDATPTLTWRGCVPAPNDALLNDVAALPDGGFVTTKSLSKDHASLDLLLGLLRIPRGAVYEWQAGSGFRELPGTRGAFPNGIAVSRDGATLYVDEWLSDEVRKISRKTGALLGSARVASPDNVSWTPDGSHLLVASHNAPLLDVFACGALRTGQCPFYFSIVSIGTEKLEITSVYENAGPPMGGGTVAVRVGNEIVIGSFAGDRLLRVSLPEWLQKSLAGA
jgi:sugar lactone lactonase YvrE